MTAPANILTSADLHPYQFKLLAFMRDTPRALLAVDCGLGKTATTLYAIQSRVREGTEPRWLVVAPPRVARATWPTELSRWADLDLDMVLLDGSPSSRARKLMEPAAIHVISRDLLPWLVRHLQDQGMTWPYRGLVLDESSGFKSHSTQRWKAARAITPACSAVYLLSGTPAPNSLMDLWAQIYLLDQGEALGKSFFDFRGRYYRSLDPFGYRWQLYPENAREMIQDAIAPLSAHLSADDYLDLPDRVDNEVRVRISGPAKKLYTDLKRDMIAQIDTDDAPIVASNAAVLAGKLHQVANGAVYSGEQSETWEPVHRAKIDALEEIAEGTGDNILVAYHFKHDLERLRKRFPDAVVLQQDTSIINRWNRGDIRMLLAHPSSCGHGLNLQGGGATIAWFSLTWSNELYIQFNARLHRQGQNRPVVIHHIITSNTVDDVILDTLRGKYRDQRELLKALRRH